MNFLTEYLLVSKKVYIFVVYSRLLEKVEYATYDNILLG